ncbi:hypothetical protein [Paenibacillus lentus]|uniref:Uncharacterized protein n=1 Tax=Paenibacillus lentus TaxID=1338368 RepID=A0A3S8S0H3_9BACL|nr:hypothetical protein [Paenibacillus lentus]AZK48594.1 hypothetical protein EIM92_22425 [Paenibacillus lentus]
MEYFSLEHDQRLEAIGGSITFPEQVVQGFEHAEDFQTAVVKPGRKQGYSCIIEHPVFLVSDEIHQIFSRFAPDMKSKTVQVLNPSTYSQDTYYMLDLPEIDCISLTHSMIEKGFVKKLVINEEPVENQPIFRIKSLIRPSLVVRLDVAEALLRTSLYGLKIQRILTEAGVEHE